MEIEFEAGPERTGRGIRAIRTQLTWSYVPEAGHKKPGQAEPKRRPGWRPEPEPVAQAPGLIGTRCSCQWRYFRFVSCLWN